MRTLDEVLDHLAYHPATPEVASTYSKLRSVFTNLAKETWDLIPDSPEKTIAFRHLHEALIYANLAIALATPADTKTDNVARVLPEDLKAKLASIQRDPSPGIKGTGIDGVVTAKDLAEGLALPVEMRYTAQVKDVNLDQYVKDGKCHGPAALSQVDEKGKQYGYCFFKICDFQTPEFYSGSQTLMDVAREHLAADAPLVDKGIS